MKKNAFTLIELLAVIVIIGFTATLIVIRIEKNVREAKNIASSSQVEMIEGAAYLYSINYSSEIPAITTTRVVTVTLNTLVNKGLIDTKSITNDGILINLNNSVLIADINNNIKTYYDTNQTGKSIIFLNGLEEIAIKKDSTYTDMGAYVAIPGTGIVELTSSNMTSTVNTGATGTYNVTYSYTNSISAIRTVKVI